MHKYLSMTFVSPHSSLKSCHPLSQHSRTDKFGGSDRRSIDEYQENKAESGDGNTGIPISGHIEGPQDRDEVLEESEVVRRINEELAEFREQLKRSQELFHSLVSIVWFIFDFAEER